MNTAQIVSLLIQASYFVAAVLLIMGIKRMSSPVTARSGIQWAGVGVLLAVVATFFHDNFSWTNITLMIVAIGLSTAVAWYSGRKVAMTAMPQMVALYNGMGGGSAAAIGAISLLGFAAVVAAPEFMPVTQHLGMSVVILAVIGALIRSIRSPDRWSRSPSCRAGWTRPFASAGSEPVQRSVLPERGRARRLCGVRNHGRAPHRCHLHRAVFRLGPAVRHPR